MALWMSSNRVGSERSISSHMANSNAIPNVPGYPTSLTNTQTIYHFNNGAIGIDSSQYARSLTVVGATNTTGKFNEAMDLTGGNHYAFAEPVSDTVNVWGQSTFQFDCWIYNTDRAGNSNSTYGVPTIVGNGRHNLNDYWWAFGPNILGNLTFYYYSLSPNQPNDIVSSSIVPINQWVHIAFTYELTGNTIKMFQDGALVHTHSVIGSPSFGVIDRKLTFGAVNSTYYQGYIDEARILINDANIWTSAFTPPTLPYALA